MIRRPPRSTRTDTLVPYTTLFRSGQVAGLCLGIEIDCGEALFARPQAGSLSPAEWNVVVDARGRKLDHHHPGLGARHEIMRVAPGRCDTSRRQAELNVIGDSERFLVLCDT